MSPNPEWIFSTANKAILLAASCIVPGGRRVDWRREWSAELWHVRRNCSSWDRSTWKGEREVAGFCLGAFPDALALRRCSPPSQRPFSLIHVSAWSCLLFLGAVLAISLAVAHIAPGVVAERHPERYQVNEGLIFIQDARDMSDWAATIPVERYRNWKRLRQRYFTELAFYRVEDPVITVPGRYGVRVRVVRGSANLFSLLGLKFRQSNGIDNRDPRLPILVLSHKVWKREFGGDPALINKSVLVDGRAAAVAGIAEDGTWRLPGDADAWLLEPDEAIASGPPGRVVARMNESGWSETLNGRVRIVDYNEDDTADELWGRSFEDRFLGPWPIYIMAVLLAFLALPAVVSIANSDYSFSSHRPSRLQDAMRRAYLFAKILLILAIAYFVSLDLTYSESLQYSPSASGLQFLYSFFICLFGLRWVVLDQRRRCPVCLRCVSHPAHVGVASMTFLAWNGTELMCEDGHTLLHVPEVTTSWFDAPRWIYLDPSWSFLFAP